MGKIRVAALGDEQEEKEQRKKADVRREAKKAKKAESAVPDADITAASDVAPVVEEKKTKKEAKGKQESQETKEPKTKAKSKKYLAVAALVEKNKLYSLSDAVELVKKTSFAKFDGTVEIHVNLNPQLLGGKNEFRGVVNLPHGSGKTVKVAIVDDDVLKKLDAGVIDFDVLIAHPSMMAKIAKFARTLGPKGLMPNPKNGTVSPDPEKRAKELSGGQVNFKTEPANLIVHLPIGKVSFQPAQLSQNITAVITAVGKSKILRVTITSTMGPGIKVDVSSI